MVEEGWLPGRTTKGLSWQRSKSDRGTEPKKKPQAGQSRTASVRVFKGIKAAGKRLYPRTNREVTPKPIDYGANSGV